MSITATQWFEVRKGQDIIEAPFETAIAAQAWLETEDDLVDAHVVVVVEDGLGNYGEQVVSPREAWAWG